MTQPTRRQRPEDEQPVTLNVGSLGAPTAAPAAAASASAQRAGTVGPGQAGPTSGDRGAQAAMGPQVAAAPAAAEPAAAAAPQTVRERILAANPNGIVVAIYAAYGRGVSDAAEFQRRAAEYAGQQGAVGLNAAGELVQGQAIGVTAIEQVGERVQALHLALCGNQCVSPVPPGTLVRSLALFAHGEPFGIGMDSGNRFTLRATNDRAATERPNTDTTARTTSEGVQTFAAGLRGAVTADVRVQLFSCSAARDQGQSEAYEDWVSHTEGERRGQNSFASELSGALGEGASVYAHTTTGHTTENYASRVFGADGGGGQGGIQIFEILYPRTYVEAEVQRPAIQQLLHGTNGPPANAAADYTAVREAMWNHYRRSIGPGRTVGGRPIGQEMMANPQNASRLLQADWTTRAGEFIRRR
ncbi:MAG: hypothetical protein IV100_19645 [Myxococcales bacterium]|nr:hypothetical protein [Myxococcales bacterium]